MKITVDQIMEMGPCEDWGLKRIEQIIPFGGLELTREAMNLVEPEDAVWVVLRILPTSKMVEFAKWCAAHAAAAAAAYDAAYAAYAADRDADADAAARAHAAAAAAAATSAYADNNTALIEERKKQLDKLWEMLKEQTK